MIRVPMYKPGKETATRIEFRSPDPSCNPYLAFAVMLAAGLEGIENKYELPDPIEEDIFEMNPAERKAHGITDLPGNLYAAILETEKSELVEKDPRRSVLSINSSKTRRLNGMRSGPMSASSSLKSICQGCNWTMNTGDPSEEYRKHER